MQEARKLLETLEIDFFCCCFLEWLKKHYSFKMYSKSSECGRVYKEPCACYHQLPAHTGLGFLHKDIKKVFICFVAESNPVLRIKAPGLCPRPVFVMQC